MLKFTKFRNPYAKILLPLRWAHENTKGPEWRNNPERMTEGGQKLELNHEKIKRDKLYWRELRLQVIGNGAHGFPSAVLLKSSRKSYLFNCGEGTQKLCEEYNVRMNKITNIFFTSAAWVNLAGISGYILTAGALGLQSLTIHGARDLDKLLSSTQNFVRVKYMDILPCDEDYFEDEVLRVKRVKLESCRPTSGNQTEVFAYICRAYDKPGHEVWQSCNEKGAPLDPFFAELESGKEISLKNRNAVRPAEAMTSTQPCPVVIILECPSEEFVDSLLASEEIAEHQNLPETDARYHAGCVVHITPGEVYRSGKYQTFLKRFPERTRHLHLHEDNTTAVSMATYTTTARLNAINDEIFPMLPKPKNENLPPMTTLCLRRDEFEENAEYHISIEDLVQEVRALQDFDSCRADLRKRVASIPCTDNREYPKLTFLGTGSTQPTKDRNVSGILVRPTENTAFLLDCGEGTLNQMIRAFGIERANELIAQLKFIYVSHMHADHHLGLPSLLLRRRNLGIDEKLTVIAPAFLTKWLEVFSATFGNISCAYRNSGHFISYRIAHGSYSSRLGVKRLTTCLVDHCQESFGIRVDLEGYSLVYSGDTRPCKNLVKLGINCDLLVHEATMEDDLVRDAAQKKHSTIGQAREMGMKMNAKFTLLTHFSQRYQKLPLIDEQYFADGRLGLAFDHMHVSPKNLHVLPCMYPMLKCVFAEDYYFAKERAQKLAAKQARSNWERVPSGAVP